MKSDAQNRRSFFKTHWLEGAAAAAIALAPVAAGAQNAPAPPTLPALPANGSVSSGPFTSWLDMVSATQAVQPNWKTPLVTVTPRLEQEFRSDFCDQHN